MNIGSAYATGCACLMIVLAGLSQAGTVEYDLIIEENEVNITGKAVNGMTINGSIPGPVLKFVEGDSAIIHIENRLKQTTSIHWHGLLVPPRMDGVPNVSFPPIRSGTTFTYRFPIIQAGTYWYHSHTDLQEQSGVYGSIVIEPRDRSAQADREYVLLFSDWTNENPHAVLRQLKRGSEWYPLVKGSAQSIAGAIRVNKIGDYFKRELQRMPPMDIADIAYDAFLVNGKPQIHLPANPGETVRLRIIDGSSTTYFHLQFAAGPMRVIAADGLDIVPFETERMLIAVAEVYDILIHIPSEGSHEFRATSHDASGWASVWLGSGKKHAAPNIPAPDIYATMGDLSLVKVFALTPAAAMGMSDARVRNGEFDEPGMAGMHIDDSLGKSMDGDMHSMQHDSGEIDTQEKHNDHGSMHSSDSLSGDNAHSMRDGEDDSTNGMHAYVSDIMPQHVEQGRNKPGGKGFAFNFRPLAPDASSADSLAPDGMNQIRPWPPYVHLKSLDETAFASGKPVRELRLTLDGDMHRYIWLINNKPLSAHDSIHIRNGEIVRFIMINRTMMHHPMHLHGHFFRVINRNGRYSPLKHTVNVAPMSTTVIEFDANEPGDWFFHCHLLYHMKTGMARVVHYEKFNLPEELSEYRPRLFTESWYFLGTGQFLSNMSEGVLTFSNTLNIFAGEWEIGWAGYDEFEWDMLVSYNRYVNRFLTVFAGVNTEGANRDLEFVRGVGGLQYLLPFNFESRIWLDHRLDVRFAFEKELMLTPRMGLDGEVQYDTRNSEWEGTAGVSYIVYKNVLLMGKWHSDYGFGGGILTFF